MAKQRREYPDPGPRPENATPDEIEKWRKANERFLMEGGQKLPTTRPKIDATDERLKQLRREDVRFLERMNPMTDALWLALLRDGRDVLADAAEMARYDAAIGTNQVVNAPEGPAIVAIATRIAANAIRGDSSAIAQIAERIEGKPGLRRGDVDPNDPLVARKSQEIIDAVTRQLTAARLERKQDDIIDVTAKVIDVVAEPVKAVNE